MLKRFSRRESPTASATQPAGTARTPSLAVVPDIPAAVALADIGSKIVLQGYEYWLARRGEHGLPSRSDFDPLVEMPTLCPSMMLKDVQQEPLDFRYRLLGTKLREHMGADWKGQWMSQIEFQKAPNPIWRAHAYVAESGMPLFLRPPYVGPHKDFLHIEAVMLPLAQDHRTVDMIMIFLEFMSIAAKAKKSAEKA